MEEVFVQSRRFFGLPLSEKMKLLRNEKHRGYTPLFDQVLDPANQINGDYKEGYYIGEEVPEDDPRAQKPHFGPNLWPSEDILPRWRQYPIVTIFPFYMHQILPSSCNFEGGPMGVKLPLTSELNMLSWSLILSYVSQSKTLLVICSG
ncbi:2-oxoglutarate-dependent dioxygenase citB-like [Eucalyptus grandis]|uniref:2-oxoglutarate-dependent dioxygenase citB-like n=1 Tax=Eucalyptus grandis TaxID=71139 RepID=UPI00192EF4ED|nr:2-oxoglutarate-dependent dioxygenase citB-like [Eucalyptus grandis]